MKQCHLSEAMQPSMPREIKLIEILTMMGTEKKIIFGLTTAFTFASIIISLLLKTTYTAKTVLLPPHQQQGGSASAILEQLGPLAGMATGAGGLKSSGEMYVAFLKGDSIRDYLIEKFQLSERYKAKAHKDARKALDDHVKIVSEKLSGLITIEVEDTDPTFASNLANAHIEALSILMGRLALSEAHQRRVFFEREVDRVSEKAFRDLRVQEAVLGGLLKQLEMARIDESKEKPLLEQIDVATPPDRKSGPKRAQIVLLSTMTGFFLGFSISLFKFFLSRFKMDSANDLQFQNFVKAWKGPN